MFNPPKTAHSSGPLGWVPTWATALKFVFGYAILGSLWILCSGWLLHYFVSDPELLALFENIKGWFFILVTALLLGQVLGRYFSQIRKAAGLLQASESRLRFLSDNLPDGYIYEFSRSKEGKARMEFVSAGVERVHGCRRAEVMANPDLIFKQLDTEQLAQYQQLEEKSSQTMEIFEMEVKIRRPDQELRYIQLRSRPTVREEGAIQWVGFALDVTQWRLAQEALRKSDSERRQLEMQLRQAQKMDAIGQLAGGVAHDFNNILCAIRIQVELAETAENTPANIREELGEIGRAAERAANLTEQLLLFSRRQVMQMRDLDLNEVVTGIAKMLQRIIGEDIRLELSLAGTPLLTRADSGMLEQVLVNLAVNSRDAMPEGGLLRLETAEIELDEAGAKLNPEAQPGRYVQLSVTDSGCGMPPEVQARIFEPFYTTKVAGKGTGLGLATVFGIIKQHRGWITLESQPGRGSTFHIHLPKFDATATAAPQEAIALPIRGGTETILFTEDDESIRKVASQLLKRHGYTVLEAANGNQAIELWEKNRERIDLLLTDLVMPEGLSGRQLAQRLQSEQPHLRVIFASGYSADMAGKELKLKQGEIFLQKPFSSDVLLAAIRRSLEIPAGF